MRPMDTWAHRDHLIKIEWMKSNNASSLHATWWNLDASSWIRQTRLKDVDSRIVVLSQSLIKDEMTHPTVEPKFAYKFSGSSTRKSTIRFFEQIKLFRYHNLRIS